MQPSNLSGAAHRDLREAGPTTGDLLWEVNDLASGAVVMLLPILLLAVPGILVFVVLPGLVLLAVAAAPLVVAGAIFAPLYLLARLVRRLLRPRRQPATGSERRSSRSSSPKIGTRPPLSPCGH